MEKLYYNNSYLMEFEAEILSVEPYKDMYAVVLDKSAFYPESGGQPSDTGSINDIPVVYVTEICGRTLHITEKQVEGKTAKCRIDWERRFDHMQQHTGQHILSASFDKLLDGATDSFHIGRDSSTIEIGIGSFDEFIASQVEELANHIVFSNFPIKAYITDHEGISKLPLRKQPKVDDNIRIIEIAEFEYSPCGGTHVSHTGEVGLIKITGWEKLKASYKIEFVCGSRALGDFQNKTSIVKSLGAKLSVKQDDIEDSFQRMFNELKEQQKQNYALSQQLFSYEANEMLKHSHNFKGVNIVSSIFENRSINEAKAIAQFIISESSSIALFVCKNETAQVIFSRSEDVAADMNSLLKSVFPIIEGKGGGNAKAAQGGGTKLQAVDEFLSTAIGKLEDLL